MTSIGESETTEELTLEVRDVHRIGFSELVPTVVGEADPLHSPIRRACAALDVAGGFDPIDQAGGAT